MSTGSSKRNRKRKGRDAWGARASSTAKRKEPATEKRPSANASRPQPSFEISERAWLIASLVILMAATALRVYALELKPMHHDEGVNGFFLTGLLRQGAYHYDPSNYHGPTLYYLSLPIVKLFGLTTYAVRFVTVLFGIGTIWLVLALRRYIGSTGTLVAAALVAFSPGCVYYSRYFIHESLFVFFTLGILVAALRFYETGAVAYLLLASASAAMLFATKETAFISVVTLGLAWAVAIVWVKWRGDGRGRKKGGAGKAETSEGLRKFLASEYASVAIIGAGALFVFLWILFYSSLFTNLQGIADSFRAFDFWGKTGMSEFHEKPVYTYANWLVQEEAPILLLGTIGACVALFERRKNRFAIFASAWAFGLLVAYSLVKYKTPWLMLSFVVPLCIAGGYAIQSIARMGAAGLKGIAFALVVAGQAIAVCATQTFVLNFREYDNDKYIYVYSHTQRDALKMLNEVDRAIAVSGQKEPGITVAADEYWPLPWYFRDYTHVGYVGKDVAASYDPQSTPVIIGRKSDDPQHDTYKKLRPILAANYVEVGAYDLRPAVKLILFERRDLAAKQ